MNYGLRLIIPEQKIPEMESFPRQSARQILALINDSFFTFSDCLELCRVQSKITPDFNYWKFAESNQDAFNSLFDALKIDSQMEDGLALINTFIMLVYLRLAAKRSTTTRAVFFLSLFRDSLSSRNVDLLWWVEHYARKLTDKDSRLLPSANEQLKSELDVKIDGFNNGIGKVLKK